MRIPTAAIIANLLGCQPAEFVSSVQRLSHGDTSTGADAALGGDRNADGDDHSMGDHGVDAGDQGMGDRGADGAADLGDGDGTSDDPGGDGPTGDTLVMVLTYLSDMPWVSADNGFGPVELDTSNGETPAGDGNPITLDGVEYDKGLGVHAPSDVRYDLGGTCASFMTDVGVDDECSGSGTVVFEVWSDGVLATNTGVLDTTMAAVPITVDITGVQELGLVVTNGGDGGSCDHADWADARVLCQQ